MQPWHRLAIASLAGLVVGIGVAAERVRSGFASGQIRNGPWTTAKTFGTTDADALTRARVALGGLLALPAKEAMYFNASTDSAGAPLDGRCGYVVMANVIEAQWWSITLYRGAGWLVPNSANRWSIGSAALPPSKSGIWSIAVSPKPVPGLWIPTGGVSRFDLTLRAYHPQPMLLAQPQRAKLPTIVKQGCI